jgi:hypothetical protein
MLPKLLAWISLATALLFAVLAIAGVFAGDDMAPTLILWAGLPLLVISILLAVALLVISAFHS